MKSQLYMFIAALMIEQAMPACAQQISEQEANQAAKSITDVLDKALHEKDAAGAVALFTKNAIRVTAEGPQIGRQKSRMLSRDFLRSIRRSLIKLIKSSSLAMTK